MLDRVLAPAALFSDIGKTTSPDDVLVQKIKRTRSKTVAFVVFNDHARFETVRNGFERSEEKTLELDVEEYDNIVRNL